MPRLSPKTKKLTCPLCDQQSVTQSLPREVDRQLSHEKITVPNKPQPRQLTVAILRITYEREYQCSQCGHFWRKTFTMESQKHV